MELKSDRFKIGQRVVRCENVYDQTSRLMHGVIIDRYSRMDYRFGPYPELYAVEWDDGLVQRGFLPHGLRLEA